MKLHTGCSGFYNRDWKGIFYPEDMPSKDWFTYYTQQFDTIEINSTFYRKPRLSTLEKWYRESSEHFLFSIKMPRYFTHVHKLAVEKKEIADFCDFIGSGLQEKLRNFLFQMPPSFQYTPERLELVCTQLSGRYTSVIEFRHHSWWQQEVFDALEAENIIFCGQSYPGNIPETVIINNDIVYYRFHGKPVLYKSLYDAATLSEVRNAVNDRAKEVFIYFNNTWGSAAIINCRQMRAL